MDWGSDGSDYGGSVAAMDEDGSCSSELSSFFEAEFLPVLPKPNLPDPSLISLELLDKTIREHIRNSTLRRALTQIDANSLIFIPHWSQPSLIPEGYFTDYWTKPKI